MCGVPESRMSTLASEKAPRRGWSQTGLFAARPLWPSFLRHATPCIGGIAYGEAGECRRADLAVRFGPSRDGEFRSLTGKQGLDTTTPAGPTGYDAELLARSHGSSRVPAILQIDNGDQSTADRRSHSSSVDRHDDAPYRHEVAGPDNGRCTYQRCGSADETIATSDHGWLATLIECHSVSILAGSRATQRRPEASLRLHSATWPTSSRCKD
jgi:hypothetical protein